MLSFGTTRAVPRRLPCSFVSPVSVEINKPLQRQAVCRHLTMPIKISTHRNAYIAISMTEHDQSLATQEERPNTDDPPSVTTETLDETLLSPMMQQYVITRRQLSQNLCNSSNRQLLLLYRVGDFFESFFEDAHLLSSICGIALTSKDAGKAFGMRAPMAGVPHYCVDEKIKMLIAENVTVAIVDQVQSASQTPAGSLVKRAVTRLISPAITSDDALQDHVSSAYVACVHVRPTTTASTAASQLHRADRGDDSCDFGLAFADVSTGEFRATDGTCLADLHSLLVTLKPRELLVCCERPRGAMAARVSALAHDLRIAVVTTRGATRVRDAEAVLTALHRVDDVESLGCRGHSRCVQAAAGLVSFLGDLGSLRDDGVSTSLALNKLTTFGAQDFMQIDESCLKNLEVIESSRDGAKERSLQWAVDRTVTTMGARRLRAWLLRPLRDVKVIEARQDVVQALMMPSSGGGVDEVRKLLRNLADLERLGGKVSTGRVTPRELRWVCETITRLPRLFECVSHCLSAGASSGASQNEGAAEWVGTVDDRLISLANEVCSGMLDPAPSSIPSELAIHGGAAGKDNWDISSSRIFCAGYNVDLDELRTAVSQPDDWITKLEESERKRCGIDTLRIKHIKNSGYVLRVPRSHGERKLNEDGTFFTRLGYEHVQSTKAEMRFSFPELKKRARQHHSAVSEVLLLERQLFFSLCERMLTFVSNLRSLGSRVACIDVVGGFAYVALERGYTRPEVVASSEERVLDVRDGRHAVVEQLLPVGRSFVCNTMQLGGGKEGREFGNLMLLCGPNAAGKSCALRSLGLMCILAQSGSFVPARYARMSVSDRVFTRVGAVDDVARGQSTFQVEMAETACILSHATADSVVLLDEIGRGTSTADGIAVAWSVAEHLSQRGDGRAPRTMFVTHFHELNHLAVLYDDVRAFHMGVRAIDVSEGADDGADDNDRAKRWLYTHVIEEGASYESMGLVMAERAGFPAEVMKRAWEIGDILHNPCKALGEELRQALVDSPGRQQQEEEGQVRDTSGFKAGFEEGYSKAIKDIEDKLTSLATGR